MPGQIGTSIRANTRKIHSGDREADAIDATGLAQARERFALLGRDVSQLADDQLRNLVTELERRFRDEALIVGRLEQNLRWFHSSIETALAADPRAKVPRAPLV